MRPEIWYREEFGCLRDLVEDAIHREDPSRVPIMLALGHLHQKLTAAMENAPSNKTPTGAA